MKKTLPALLGLGVLITLSGCSLSLLASPIPLPTLISIPSPTPLLATATTAAPMPNLPTPTMSLPTITTGAPMPTAGILSTPTTGSASTPTTSGTLPGVPSGPYGVIQVLPGELLSIHSGPGVGYPVSGSFSAEATNIMRSGASATADGDLWVQVQNPEGGSGWVNANFLTEYVVPATFCTDSRINSLLKNFGNALKTSSGETLASLVSPVHGMTVYLWRYGLPHTFKQSDARWLFDSTYAHNWGAAPASGLDTMGSFHEKVLPWLQEVFNAGYSLTCNSLGTATQYGSNPWPIEYANLNFYTVYKPGTPGVDLDFRYWLVGVEYVQGQPTIFAVIHFAWEP